MGILRHYFRGANPSSWLDGAPQGLLGAAKKQLRVELLRKGDLEEAVAVMRDSFSGTESSDPEGLFDWILGPEVRGRWTDPRRLEYVEWFMKLIFISAVDSGGLVLGARSTRPEDSGALLAVCAAFPPGCTNACIPGLFNWKMYSTLLQMLSLPPGDKALPGSFRRLGISGDVAQQAHATHANEPHYYVAVMATSPIAQGRGCCRALFDAVNWLADRDGVPAYLEAVGERNVAVYTRLGFEAREQYPVDDGNDAMPHPMTAMVRRPS